MSAGKKGGLHRKWHCHKKGTWVCTFEGAPLFAPKLKKRDALIAKSITVNQQLGLSVKRNVSLDWVSTLGTCRTVKQNRFIDKHGPENLLLL